MAARLPTFCMLYLYICTSCCYILSFLERIKNRIDRAVFTSCTHFSLQFTAYHAVVRCMFAKCLVEIVSFMFLVSFPGSFAGL